MPVDLQALYPKPIQLMLDAVFVVDELIGTFICEVAHCVLTYKA